MMQGKEFAAIPAGSWYACPINGTVFQIWCKKSSPFYVLGIFGPFFVANVATVDI